MCWSRNIHTPPQKGLEFPGGGGSVRPKNVKKCMRLTGIWNFHRSGGGGGGVLEKSFPWGSYGYFLELHNESCTLIAAVTYLQRCFMTWISIISFTTVVTIFFSPHQLVRHGLCKTQTTCSSTSLPHTPHLLPKN